MHVSAGTFARWMLIGLLLVPWTSVAAAQPFHEDEETGPIHTSPGPGSLLDERMPQCGDLLFYADGTYEASFGWQNEGVVPPDYGSFAECYNEPGMICSAVFDLTRTSEQLGRTMDVYIWSDAGGIPGPVLCVQMDVDPGEVSQWPSFSRHIVEIQSMCCVEEPWWIGYWGNWPGQVADWAIGADMDGPSTGCALTKVAPGIGFPTGWQNVSVAWGPTRALAIGAEILPCSPVPTRDATWGRVKLLFEVAN